MIYTGDGAHVNKIILKEILEIYTETTKISTQCMNSLNLTSPLFSFGLDFSLLKEYIDFDEIISFLYSEFNRASDIPSKPNAFHTFYTKNLFVYTIVFIRTNSKTKVALVAGPTLTHLPSKDFIDQLFIQKVHPLHKKYEFVGLINSLSLFSSEHICQLGKLLLAITNSCAVDSYSSFQNVHGIKIIEEPKYKNIKFTTYPDIKNNFYRDFYKFCFNLGNKIKHGSVNGIKDIVGENRDLFNRITSIGDNNRSLKNICIIICSVACQFAIQANAPFERMFYNFGNSIITLESLSSEHEIIVQMIATVEGFAHTVFTLSDNTYSLHIHRVLQYIKHHFSEKLMLKQLAEYTQIHPVYLSSLIKKETNMSLSNHINLIRIEESKKLLIYSNKSIQDIAYDVGYNHQSHFNTVFKKMEGLTPLEFRSKMGSENFV